MRLLLENVYKMWTLQGENEEEEDTLMFYSLKKKKYVENVLLYLSSFQIHLCVYAN